MPFLLDTNFLLIPVQFKVDIYEELTAFGKPEFYTLSVVVAELGKLERAGGRKGRQAALALTQMKQAGVRVLPARGHADTALVKAGKTGKFAVCTQDRALIKKLKSHHVPVIRLRQKRTLERA